MITSAKNYSKNKKNKNKIIDRETPRTNGVSKATQTKSHKEAYTYTLRKKEKGKKDISIYKKRKKDRTTKSINKSTNDSKL